VHYPVINGVAAARTQTPLRIKVPDGQAYKIRFQARESFYDLGTGTKSGTTGRTAASQPAGGMYAESGERALLQSEIQRGAAGEKEVGGNRNGGKRDGWPIRIFCR